MRYLGGGEWAFGTQNPCEWQIQVPKHCCQPTAVSDQWSQCCLLSFCWLGGGSGIWGGQQGFCCGCRHVLYVCKTEPSAWFLWSVSPENAFFSLTLYGKGRGEAGTQFTQLPFWSTWKFLWLLLRAQKFAAVQCWLCKAGGCLRSLWEQLCACRSSWWGTGLRGGWRCSKVGLLQPSCAEVHKPCPHISCPLDHGRIFPMGLPSTVMPVTTEKAALPVQGWATETPSEAGRPAVGWTTACVLLDSCRPKPAWEHPAGVLTWCRLAVTWSPQGPLAGQEQTLTSEIPWTQKQQLDREEGELGPEDSLSSLIMLFLFKNTLCIL